jgi:cell division septation protein DedD
MRYSYASKVRGIVQSELMNLSLLNELLDQLVDALGMQQEEKEYTAAEVQQVRAQEREAVVKKKPAVEEEPVVAPAYTTKESKQGFDVIAGFYINKATANKMASRLHAQGCDAYIIEKNDGYYVSMGSAPTRTKAEALFNHLKSWYDGDIAIKQW